ncbi:COP9 signalosome (CSN) subunit [Dimargaris verticillata]|uniref:Protein CSN12 homolog n=1 Tax=Dimargaris verticillata TaxID=2761393 RepID=A0A9W8B4E9_9FUNG|nr:COP9 signalosome (CSN) subunit [Dimargaris verticillata]
MKFEAYISKLNKAIYVQDQHRLADLLQVRSITALSACEDAIRTRADVKHRIPKVIRGPWADVIVSHCECIKARLGRDCVEACTRQISTVTDLYGLACEADDYLRRIGDKTGRLEESARVVNRAFSTCINDSNFESPRETSRQQGTYFLVGLLFQIYFRLDTKHLCKNVLRVLSKVNIADLKYYPRPHQIKFKYYEGRYEFYNGNFTKAGEYLEYALQRCHKSYPTNKQRILAFLIPTRLYQGILPMQALLERYPALGAVYQPLVTAIKTGNIKLFDERLAQHEHLLLRQGTYLALEQARNIAIRTLFKKVYLVLGKTTRLQFHQFQAALKFVGMAIESAEVECMLAAMIYKGYIRGYLSHEHQTLVLSKNGPFPSLGSVLRSN